MNRPGRGFDSKLEARVALALEAMRKARDPRQRVTEVRRQVRYELLPKQHDFEGRVIERAVHYVADFVVRFADARLEVIDVKSPITARLPAYVLKRKLMLYRHRIRVKEILRLPDLSEAVDRNARKSSSEASA